MAIEKLAGLKIVVAGGDEREKVLALELAKQGAKVWLYGFSRGNKYLLENLSFGLPPRADVIILPLSGLDEDGNFRAAGGQKKINLGLLEALFFPGVLLICGHISRRQQDYLNAKGIKQLEAGSIEELAVLNAIPTAEGALAFAINNSPLTLSGSSVLVAGFGRCAKPLARLLKAFGARVTVAARKRKDLALARTLGYRTVEFTDLQANSDKYDFIFNTVPAPVINVKVLQNTHENSLIIDLASSPGGTDFTAAKKLGLKAFLLPGIPGKTAPVTAGKILAEVYAHYIALFMKGGSAYETCR